VSRLATSTGPPLAEPVLRTRTIVGRVPRSGPGSQRRSRLCRGRQSEEDATGVVLEDLCLVGWGQVDGLHRLECDVDVFESALRVERHVGGEHDAIDTEEIDAAAQRGDRPDGDGVGIELPEVVERMLLEPDRLVLDTCGIEQLVIALPDPLGGIRRETAQVMRDDLDIGVAIEDAGPLRTRCRRASQSHATYRTGSPFR